MRSPKPFLGRSLTSSGFLEKFVLLTRTEQLRAREAHRQWLDDTRMPGLRFKKVHETRPIYSVRVNLNIRAVGIESGEVIWFWIRPHEEYEMVLKNL